MSDQATALRRLVQRAAREGPADDAPRPRLIVVSGARSGVGTTTLAVNLAVALAEQGTRVALVDADPYRPEAARLCDLPLHAGVADVLAARREIHEVLQHGPAGVWIAAGARAAADGSPFGPAAQRRLLRQLRSLGRLVELVLIDTGGAGSAAAQRFWQAADQVALVVTPQPACVLDAYAKIKQAAAGDRRPAVRLIVNQAADQQAAERVHRRIDLSCRRFLGWKIGCLGDVPEDPLIPAAAAAPRPFALGGLPGEAAGGMNRIARQILDHGRTERAAAGAPPRARHTEKGKTCDFDSR